MASPSVVAARWDSAMRALLEVFGFSALRPFQERVVGAALADRDVFAVAPTGAGKTLTFSLPALVLPGTAIVISPLLALMADQDKKLCAAGVPSCRITSDVSRAQVVKALRDLSQYEIVFVSPEKAATKEFRQAVAPLQVSLWIIDEAHVAAQEWRPSYAHLLDLFDEHPGAVRFACTATADARTEDDIKRMFGLRSPERVVGSPWRENLIWDFQMNAGYGDLIDLVNDHHQRPGSQIVYVSSRNEAEEVSRDLRSAGIDAAYYHAGMERNTRAMVQDRFMEKSLRCIVATSAFGMGVDVSDIRLVANWQLPSSLFDLLQQSGRGSRDGQPAAAWVRLGDKAEKSQRFFIEQSNPKFRVYERLWDKFAAQDGQSRWSSAALCRVAGVSDRLMGQVSSALAYLEYTGHITQIGAGKSYKLPVRDYVRATRMAGSHGARVDGGFIHYDVAPGKVDNAQAFVLNGASEWAIPSENTLIRPKAGALRLTEEDIDNRRSIAEGQLQSIYDFSRSSDRAAFVANAFAK